MGNQTYTGGGVIPLIELNKGEIYIVLAKRSEDAPQNPGMHSAFFGGADFDKKEEGTRPFLIALREITEEFLVISKNKQNVYSFKINGEKYEDYEKVIKRLCFLWCSEKDFWYPECKKECTKEETKKSWEEQKEKINFEDNVINGRIKSEIEYIEYDGKKKIYIVQFSFDNLNDKIILDGETKKEKPINKMEKLIDRQIDIFNLENFKKWWLDNEKSALDAELSFKEGRKIRRGFIERNKNKISPSLILALNKWEDFKEKCPDRGASVGKTPQ